MGDKAMKKFVQHYGFRGLGLRVLEITEVYDQDHWKLILNAIKSHIISGVPFEDLKGVAINTSTEYLDVFGYGSKRKFKIYDDVNSSNQKIFEAYYKQENPEACGGLCVLQ